MRAASISERTRTDYFIALGARMEVRGANQQMTAPAREFIDTENQQLHGASLPLMKRMENALWDDSLSSLLCCLPTAPKPPEAHRRTVRAFEIQSNTNPTQGSPKGRREI